jgi:hypothetical protein
MRKLKYLVGLLIVLWQTQMCFAQARVQFVHNLSVAAFDTIDIWYGPNKVGSNLNYRSSTAYTNLPSNSYQTLSITNANSTAPNPSLISLNNTIFPTDDHFQHIIYGDNSLNTTVATVLTTNHSLPSSDTLAISAFNGIISNNLWSLKFSRGSSRNLTAFGGLAFSRTNKVDTAGGRLGIELFEKVGNNQISRFNGSLPDPYLKGSSSLSLILSGGLQKHLFIVPSGGGNFIPLSLLVGLDVEQENNIFSIGPNPCTSYCLLKTRGEAKNIIFFASNGKAVSPVFTAIGPNTYHVNVSNLEEGIYIISAEVQNQRIFGKLIVAH